MKIHMNLNFLEIGFFTFFFFAVFFPKTKPKINEKKKMSNFN